MKKFRLLVCCEESQRVCIAFRERGWEAYSCDIEPCSGGHPEWHIQQDVLPLINGDCEFDTVDGEHHIIEGEWDLLICHPPCTYLTVAGNRWFNVDKYGEKAIKRMKDREKAVDFFMKFINASCNHIAVENPVGIMSNRYRKPNQIIQPYYFGEHARKGTCLWLKDLPNLKETNVVDPGVILDGGYSVGASANWATNSNGKALRWNDPETAKARSKTFPGIAQAMADQWGSYIENNA